MALSLINLFEDLILGDNLIKADSEALIRVGGTFSPPNVAIMNAVRTPALEATSVVNSNDYLENQSRAHSGFSPMGINIFPLNLNLNDSIKVESNLSKFSN